MHLDPQYVLESNQVSFDTATQQVLLETDKQTYRPGSTIKLVIPTGRANTMLLTSDTYLYFTVTNKQTKPGDSSDFSPTNPGGFYVDKSAECFFNRLEVIHNEVVEVRSATNVHSALQMDLEPRVNKLMLTAGGFDDGYGASLASHVNHVTADFVGGSPSRRFCIPLRSSVIGRDNPRALPLFMMSGSDIILHLTLEDASSAVAWGLMEDKGDLTFDVLPTANTISYEISEVYLGCSIVQLSNRAAAKLVESYPNAVVTTPFVGHSMATAEPTGLQQIDITSRYARAARIEVLPRAQALVKNPTVFSLSNRQAPSTLRHLSFDVGGITLPTRRISEMSRCAYHSLMCERLHLTKKTDVLFDLDMYTRVNPAYTVIGVDDEHSLITKYRPGQFFVAQNFDYTERDFSYDSLIQGWDLKGVTTQLLIDADFTVEANGKMRYDFFITNLATLAVKDSILRSWH